jgi:hypothetical protein
MYISSTESTRIRTIDGPPLTRPLTAGLLWPGRGELFIKNGIGWVVFNNQGYNAYLGESFSASTWELKDENVGNSQVQLF